MPTKEELEEMNENLSSEVTMLKKELADASMSEKDRLRILESVMQESFKNIDAVVPIPSFSDEDLTEENLDEAFHMRIGNGICVAMWEAIKEVL